MGLATKERTEGTVTDITDHGSIIIIWVGDATPIYCDHRMFSHLWEAEEGNIIGRRVTCEETDDGPTIYFDD